MALYDRPLSQIIVEEALSELGEPFSASDMVEWVRARYPLFKDNTIRSHLRAMAANDPSKKHYHSPRRDVLLKVDRGLYRKYDPDRDGIYDEGGRLLVESDDEDEIVSDLNEEASQEAMGFALEQHLEDFMEKNWERINFGSSLRLYDDGTGRKARQYSTSVGPIDLLCEDTSTGDLVVVELKKGRPSDAVLGQCQRYMGWVQQNLAKPGQKVRGLIVAPEIDDRLRYGLVVAQNVQLRCYKVDFQLFDPEAEATR